MKNTSQPKSGFKNALEIKYTAKKKHNLKAGILASGIKAAGFQNRLLNGTGEPALSWGGLVRSSEETFGNKRRAKGLNQLSFKIKQPEMGR